ncbi:MAG: hypothetical protein AB7I30_17605, partial [Isosphaeraceae bacterium]
MSRQVRSQGGVWGVAVLVVAVAALTVFRYASWRPGTGVEASAALPVALEVQLPVDPFTGGMAWLNVSGPITLK